MNTLRKFSLVILAGLFITACQNDDELTDSQGQLTAGDRTEVTFEVDANIISPEGSVLRASNAITPGYTADGFSIYAFRNNGTDYVYSETVTLTNPVVAEEGKKLTGKANLLVGDYKFVGAYGLNNAPNGTYNLPTWSSQPLTNNLLINYPGTQNVTELFLQTDVNASSLPNYDFTNGATESVSITLKRAVSRVDVMFISADKNPDGTYTEKPYTGASNIFNDFELQALQLRMRGLNNAMNFFGVNATTTQVDQNINLSNFANSVVVGSGQETIIGEGYTRFDNVQSADIIQGAAHVFGSYFFPNNDATKTTELDIYISSTNGLERTIPISIDDDHKLPLERNKVTLVKVYVLNDNHVFSTTVDFAVEIDTVWEDPNEVSGEIK
ncbi:MAG: hypothetical protein LIO93_11025 [Bacteroidales bacterium]|nr:hypothetical protein [Bacteroidales bacterium]